jgi:hypothetical protein
MEGQRDYGWSIASAAEMASFLAAVAVLELPLWVWFADGSATRETRVICPQDRGQLPTMHGALQMEFESSEQIFWAKTWISLETAKLSWQVFGSMFGGIRMKDFIRGLDIGY